MKTHGRFQQGCKAPLEVHGREILQCPCVTNTFSWDTQARLEKLLFRREVK